LPFQTLISGEVKMPEMICISPLRVGMRALKEHRPEACAAMGREKLPL
jgi:hypothetical protein